MQPWQPNSWVFGSGSSGCVSWFLPKVCCFKWVFPKIGVPQNGWFVMENSLKWMIWGYHYFRKHPNVYLQTPRRRFLVEHPGGDVSRRHTQRESRGFPEKGGTRFKYEVKMQPQITRCGFEVQLFLGVLGVLQDILNFGSQDLQTIICWHIENKIG